MTLEEALTAKLEAVLSAVLASEAIYPDAAPQDETPTGDPATRLVYQHAGDDNLITLDGQRPNPRIDLYTLDIYGVDRVAIEAIRDALYDAFAGANGAGFWGGNGTGPHPGLYVEGAVVSDATADADPPAQGDESIDRAERLLLRIIWRKP